MYISPIKQVLNSYSSGYNSNRAVPHFMGMGLSGDTFEKREKQECRVKLFNPFSNNYCSDKVNIDLNNQAVFEIENKMDGETPLVVDYDPARRGSLYDKKSGRPFSVNILKTTTENFPNSVGYHFVSKDLSHEYGYVHLFKSVENNSELTRDYEDIGVVGDRIEVLYLRNFEDSKIGGVGKLADKMAVRYCLENGIEPNVVSYADTGSHVAHYKRGKRFIEPEKGSEEWEFLKLNYGKTNPNEILEELIKKSEKENDFVDLSGWGYLVTYMPKELADRYR